MHIPILYQHVTLKFLNKERGGNIPPLSNINQLKLLLKEPSI